MASLAAYLDIAITLDFKQGKIIVDDVSAYPEGVSANIKGIINTIQPDGVERAGSWDTPDIVYPAQGKVELRKQADLKPQQGEYTVSYTVDHPDYTPSTITKKFNFSYSPVEVIIDEQFDVFTPVLKVNDATDYQRAGFNAPTLNRYWLCEIKNVGSIASGLQLFDLAHESAYYDAEYDIALTTSLEYVHSTYNYLTVVDSVTGTLETQANTPPSYTELKEYLKVLKQRFDESANCDTAKAKEDYTYATSVLSQIKSRICSSDFVGLYDQIQDFLNVYHNHVTVAYVNTAAPLTTYDYSDVDCGSGGVGNDPRISSTDIINWNAAFNAMPSDDLEFIVGVTAGAPVAGADTFVSAALVGKRVRLKVNKIPVSTLDWQGNFYYAKPKISDTLTIYNNTWANDDLIQIELY